MKKIGLISLIFLFCWFARANEGMLIPTVLNAFESDMQAMGMQLSAEDIYSINHASIKDAIIHFGGGCTASLISNKGLLLTNYHCGYYQIVSHSTPSNNLEKNGFYASNFKAELKTSLTASRMVRIENVTKRVLAGTDTLSERDAYQMILSNIAKIKAETVNGTRYNAAIKPFDFGNSYYLLISEVFHDIRLVGAPPSSIGKFGGDTDNWVWPRHTGDFSLFRIYVDKTNNSAPYSTDNVPYSPISYLPISILPKHEGDFTMVFGFPGKTYQHTISSRLDFIINELRSAQIKMRGLALSAINPAMEQSETLHLMYATKQSRIANAWKKWQGQIEGLKIEGALNDKIAYEKNYTNTARGKIEWNDKYGKVIEALKKLTAQFKKEELVYRMYVGYTYIGSDLFKRARNFEKLMQMHANGKTQKLAQEIKDQLASIDKQFTNFDKAVDAKIFLLQSQFYKEKVDSVYLPSALLENNINELTATIYQHSFLVNKDSYRKVLEHFDRYAKRKINKDPGYLLFQELQTIFNKQLLNKLRTYYSQKNYLLKIYVAGKYEMFPKAKHWPNANSTLRLSYGKLEGLSPRDGLEYDNYTTMKGVIAKYYSGKPEYDLPSDFVDLYQQKKWGIYGQDGELWTCILTSNHTTGGNSGSPIIGAKGYLIGLNFDRNWEGTMSDFKFDTKRCRNISVDIRYVLWLIDVYGKAHHLIEEMTIVDE